MLVAETHSDTYFAIEGVSNAVSTVLRSKQGENLGDVIYNFIAAKVLNEVYAHLEEEGPINPMDLGEWRSLSKRSELRRNSWPALQLFSRQSRCDCVVGARAFTKKSSVWPGREGSWRLPFAGAGCCASTMGRQEEGLQGDDGSAAFQEGFAG